LPLLAYKEFCHWWFQNMLFFSPASEIQPLFFTRMRGKVRELPAWKLAFLLETSNFEEAQ
jgi:hypothetical protein